ncbi:MAG: hypothetical protein ACI855_001798, partial [Myxococcota bacterium]
RAFTTGQGQAMQNLAAGERLASAVLFYDPQHPLFGTLMRGKSLATGKAFPPTTHSISGRAGIHHTRIGIIAGRTAHQLA